MELDITKKEIIQLDEHMDVNGSWVNTSGQYSAFLDIRRELWYSDKNTEPIGIFDIHHLKSYSKKESSNYDFVLITLDDSQGMQERSELLYRIEQGIFPKEES